MLTYWFLFDFLRWNQYDSPSFVGGARMLFGLDGGYDFQSRLTKPLALVVPGLIEYLFGIKPSYIFIMQNVIFFYLTGIYLFKLIFLISKSFQLSLTGMLLYIFCQPFAVYTLFILSDVTGWFFGIYAIYLSIKYINKQNNNFNIILIGFTSGIGMLFKESAIIGLIFAIIYIMLYHITVKNKIHKLFYLFVGFIVPVAISFIIISHVFHDSIINRVLFAHKAVSGDTFKFTELKQIYRILDVYWFFVIVAIINIIKNFRKINLISKAAILSLLFSSVLMPVWPYYSDRILFMVAPFLLIISLTTIQKFDKYAMFLIIAGGVINIITTYIIYKYNYNGLLYISGFTYFLLLVLIIYIKNKNLQIKFLFK